MDMYCDEKVTGREIFGQPRSGGGEEKMDGYGQAQLGRVMIHDGGVR